MLHLCQHQLRLSPTGNVIGFDLAPFLTLAKARGYPVAVMSELLQAAECGMLEAVNKADTSTEPLLQPD